MIRKDSRLMGGFFFKSFSVEFWLSAEKISQLTNSWRYHQLGGSLGGMGGGRLKRDYNAQSSANTASLLYTRVVWLGRDASIMAHSRKRLLAFFGLDNHIRYFSRLGQIWLRIISQVFQADLALKTKSLHKECDFRKHFKWFMISGCIIFRQESHKTRLKGSFQKEFFPLDLIFWIVMGFGIARFGRRGLKAT